MKTTVVPAQITTVEDRIIGNFTFAQILILIIPLVTSTALYLLISPKLHLNVFKTFLIGSQFFFFGLLASRINGKIMADWLSIFLRFSLRPRIYVFTKNDLTSRELSPVIFEQTVAPTEKPKKECVEKPALTFPESTRLNRLLADPTLSVRFELSKKGGLNVSLKPVKS
jgi:hypothetical protein